MFNIAINIALFLNLIFFIAEILIEIY